MAERSLPEEQEKTRLAAAPWNDAGLSGGSVGERCSAKRALQQPI